MKEIRYQNRYGDIFTFEVLNNTTIKWSGDFKYVGISFENDYSKAYIKYIESWRPSHENGLPLTLDEFKIEIHKYDSERGMWSEIADKYSHLVEVKNSEYNSIDPSGGPFISIGMDLGSIDTRLQGKIVDEFIYRDGYYLIKTKYDKD